MQDDTEPRAPSGTPRPARRAFPLHTQILIGMVAGGTLGLIAHHAGEGRAGLQWSIDNISYPLGQIFLRLIFMVVIPLILSAIILGVAELGDVRRLGRIGFKTLLFTLVLSSVSVLIGVGLANVIRPGEGLSEPAHRALEAIGRSAAPVKEPPQPKTGLQTPSRRWSTPSAAT